MRSFSHDPRVARAIRPLVTLCLLVHAACTDVDGGAVELSWKLRAATGSTEAGDVVKCGACDQPRPGEVAKIRINWDGDAGSGSDVWCCKDGHGVTGFDLPAGDVLLTVTPICANDVPAEPDTYTAPAPEQRHVITGNTISLGAVELVLQVSSCGFQRCVCR
jgi:hypothetical protein